MGPETRPRIQSQKPHLEVVGGSMWPHSWACMKATIWGIKERLFLFSWHPPTRCSYTVFLQQNVVGTDNKNTLIQHPSVSIGSFQVWTCQSKNSKKSWGKIISFAKNLLNGLERWFSNRGTRTRALSSGLNINIFIYIYKCWSPCWYRV